MEENGSEGDGARREADIAHTLVRLADSSVTASDELLILTDLCESCVRVLDTDIAGIALGVDGQLRFVVGTDEDAATIESVQSRLGEGPCWDAYRTRESVHSGDLSADRSRWPAWADHALELGIRAADAFPMRLRDRTIGALNMYTRRARKLSERDLLIGRAFADIATIGLLHERGAADAERTRGQLQHALDSRVLIEQAKGVLMTTHGVDAQAAFELLRTQSRSHNEKIANVARAVIDGELQL